MTGDNGRTVLLSNHVVISCKTDTKHGKKVESIILTPIQQKLKFDRVSTRKSNQISCRVDV